MKDYDVFISFAEEDKPFVNSLAKGLQDKGLKVWYSRDVLKIGDSISEKINEGLSQSRYGIVVFSHNYLLPKKKWPQAELYALFAKATHSGKKVILPIWKDIEYDEVLERMPLYAELFSLSSSIGIDRLVKKIFEAVKTKEDEAVSTLQADIDFSFIHKGIRFIFVPDLKRERIPAEKGGFYLSATPISVSQWELIMNKNKIWDNQAKDNVSPNDCLEFIEKLCEGLEGFLCQLPTISQLQDAYLAQQTLALDFVEDEGNFEICIDANALRDGQYPLWHPDEAEKELIKIPMPKRIKGNIFRIALAKKKIQKQNSKLNHVTFDKWRNLIAHDNLERVLSEIYSHPSVRLLDFQNEVIIHHSGLIELNNRERMSILSFTEYSLKKNMIRNSVLQLISKIENNYLSI